EGDGFEPSVPRQESRRFRDTSPASHDGFTVSRPGTDSSNPSSSSRQSVSLPQPRSKVENPAFRAGLGSWLGARVSTWMLSWIVVVAIGLSPILVVFIGIVLRRK